VDDLRRHNCLGFNFQRAQPVWPMRTGGRIIDRMVTGNLLANNGETVRRLAVAGAGLARLGEYHVREDLAAGRLVEVLADHGVGDEEQVAALYLGGRRAETDTRGAGLSGAAPTQLPLRAENGIFSMKCPAVTEA